ncbi:hypothetical protein IEQ34_009446 [Dendrobium chrysotoxum]|uniref:Uncharacterized protein n=1 Tax=Dendrobium chrysotoxum TaxID=161865 RepID=A0AAV7H0E9_DENCH|nr:hypothetical protein IEQ34_009446 [Dendrobium chrysotoxum]
MIKIFNVHDAEHHLYEIRYLNKYIEEEFLFKVGLFIQAGRFNAMMLKKSTKMQEPLAPASKVALKRITKVRLAQCKIGVAVEGLTSSQASDDPPSDLGDDNDIESKHRKVFSNNDKVVKIV